MKLFPFKQRSRRNVLALAVLSLGCVVGLTARAQVGEAKVYAPDYLVVLLDEGAVELTGREVEAWLSDAKKLELAGPVERPSSAVDAVGFWGATRLTQPERISFAASEAGRRHAGWWSPAGTGGTIALRGQFFGAEQVQESVYLASEPLPTGTVASLADQRGSSVAGDWVLVGGLAASLVLAGLVAFLWLRRVDRYS